MALVVVLVLGAGLAVAALSGSTRATAGPNPAAGSRRACSTCTSSTDRSTSAPGRTSSRRTSTGSRSRPRTAGSSASGRTCVSRTARCRRSTCSTCTTACGPTADAATPRAAVPRAVLRRRRGEDRARAPRGLRLPVPHVRTRGTSTTWSTTSPRSRSQVYLTYDVDFVPATSPQASGMKAVHPIWLDVQNGKVYPVFDVLKGSGHRREVHLSRRRPERAAEEPVHAADRRRAGEDVRASPPRWPLRHVLGLARRSDPDGVHVEGASTTSPRARCRGTCR